MHKKLTGIIIFLIVVFSVGVLIQVEPLSHRVLRLHIIANSDEPADQALKLAVKDDIINSMKPRFSNAYDMNDAKQMAEHDIAYIQSVAEANIRAHGYDYPVNVVVGEYEFPIKSYGSVVFPAGTYQAVRVIIGEGQGKNWWCVLFPPLCLVSSTDQGLSLSSPQEARVTFKCLEFLPARINPDIEE
ncbi:MAG: stage II sporulation protein R [Syntrophomonas sp.]|nr:stage II sporulation protein R [Syntrophomonas sp.]